MTRLTFLSRYAIAGLLAACSSISFATAETSVPHMTLSATGTASGVPNMAVVTVGVENTGKDAAEAMGQNAAQMQSVFDALAALGIAEGDISTSGLSLIPRHDSYERDKTPEISGYVVRNQIAVTTYDVGGVGDVLDQMIQAGANSVQSVRFDIKDKSSLESSARQDAAAQVQVIAQDYAAALGTDIVGILSITQNAQFPAPQMMMRGAAMESSVPVAAGDVDVSVTLNVTYEITGAGQ